MINVTKTYLPNKDKYIKYVEQVFNNGWVTNNGPFVKELEVRLAQYLNVKNVVLVSNGTVALEIAYRALGISGYAITTPFSFVATTSSLVTNGIKPIFADINPKTLNINPFEIEKQITQNTTAIVPVHVFGNACDVEVIDSIAKKNNLKVIYDAAHAFGVKIKDKSILSYGDISTLSFHATKLFHTIEGGALIINDDSLVEKARYLINFGIENTESIPELGTNAKMNELEAIMGLCILDEIDDIIANRSCIYNKYLSELEGIVEFQLLNDKFTNNYSYFPVLFKNEDDLLSVQKNLKEKNIFPRRYFFPSLDSLSYIEPKQYCNISRVVSKKILCLPLYQNLAEEDQDMIISIIKKTVNA